ncbi:Uncharacterised protein [Cardiobacterium hominis]|uniref:Uncharacterized protein n=1 Tax=Cardiobacterium hominis (strain ATCC 15826 / DSM 8339 / NCTC 10426 / 6573) TaxID=638300 RepID=C8NAY8_CARH6|nr:hypothetical protein [Cardiobacterium hominis]EEV88225.1 hypothetical protein HMPREF0198_1666 [Cardiobacterium hominis ATCC 15826]VEG78008.1 Uncharacterised protein [Cardiobacterium hominis]
MSNKQIDADAVWQETAASEKALVAAAATAGQIEMNQLLGRLQATQAIAAMLDGLSLAQIAQIKEGKRYKQLAGQKMVIGGVEIRLDTWEGFCAALGSSRRGIEEKLDNLRLLGEEALDKATALGMTTQELRKLRRLDASDQQIVIGEIEVAAGDKEAIIDLITDMAAKHSKEREELQAKLEDQRGEAAASERIIEERNKRIDKLEKQLHKQQHRTMEEKRQQQMTDAGAAQILCLAPLAGLDDAIDTLLGEDDAACTRHAANLLHELRAAVEDLQLKYGLGDVANPDDSWMQGGFDTEQAAQANELK